MGWVEIIIALVAVYGAIISTYNLIIHRERTKVRVKIKLSFGFLHYSAGLDSKHSLILEAINIGARPVTISSQGFILPNKRQLICPNPYSNVQFPLELSEGRNCMSWYELKIIADALAQEGFSGIFKLVGFYRDVAANTYMSKPLKFDIDKYSG